MFFVDTVVVKVVPVRNNQAGSGENVGHTEIYG